MFSSGFTCEKQDMILILSNLTVRQVSETAERSHVGGAARHAVAQQLWRRAAFCHHPIVLQHLEW